MLAIRAIRAIRVILVAVFVRMSQFSCCRNSREAEIPRLIRHGGQLFELRAHVMGDSIRRGGRNKSLIWRDIQEATAFCVSRRTGLENRSAVACSSCGPAAVRPPSPTEGEGVKRGMS